MEREHMVVKVISTCIQKYTAPNYRPDLNNIRTYFDHELHEELEKSIYDVDTPALIDETKMTQRALDDRDEEIAMINYLRKNY